MGIIGDFVSKFGQTKESKTRDLYAELQRCLDNASVCGHRAEFASMCETTASVWRRGKSEALGREMRDTPMPGVLDGIVIQIDESIPFGHIHFEAVVEESNGTLQKEVFDITA